MLIVAALFFLIGLVSCAADIVRSVVARKVGLRVELLELGIGPIIYASRANGARFVLRLLPVLTLQNVVTGFPSFKAGDDETDSQAYPNRPFGARVALVSVRAIFGALVSFVAAWIYFGAVNLPFDRLAISEVIPGAPAEQAGLRALDEIVGSPDFALGGSGRFLRAIQSSDGRPLRFDIERGRQVLTATVTPRAQNGRFTIGIRYRVTTGPPEPLGVAAGASAALGFVGQAISDFRAVVARLWGAPPGRPGVFDELFLSFVPSGYLGATALILTALAAAIFGILNLLPTPLVRLDGGRLFINLVSLVTGQPVGRLEGSSGRLINLVALIIIVAVLATT